MVDAFYRNKREGRIVAGGSTISQQTAKNVFCTPARTYTRKLIEAYFTALIELFWGKERILEVYLNVIELGDGIFGVEAAAQEHYCTSALRLSYSQAKDLARIIPNPRGWLWEICGCFGKYAVVMMNNSRKCLQNASNCIKMHKISMKIQILFGYMKNFLYLCTLFVFAYTKVHMILILN